MKSRRVILTIEVDTDLKLADLNYLRIVDVNVRSSGHMQRLDVLQSKANVIESGKRPKK